MRYVLGVDGGGSKLACLAANESGELLGYGRGGGVNTNYVPMPQVMESVRHAIGAALQRAGLRGEDIEAMSISAPLGPEIVDWIDKDFGIRNIIRAAEGKTPHWAARFWTEGRVGVTVDGGTGSLSRGWAEDGRETGAGGWGVALGDEGSGYWIGMKAMRAVMQAYDGRLEKTLLTQPILEHIGLSRPDELPSRVLAGIEPTEGTASGRTTFVVDSGTLISDPASEGVGHGEKPESSEGGLFYRKVSHEEPLLRHEVASLAPVVVEVARQGDRTALEIIAEAGHELGRLGTAVIERLGMGEDEFVVVPFGGVFRSGDLVLRSFADTIHAAAPRARVFISKFEPEVGAVLIALDNIGVVIDDRVIEAIERSSSDFPSCRAS